MSSRKFLRDVSFHLIAITSIAIVGLIGKVNVWTSMIFFELYICYVYVVMSGLFNDPETTAKDIESKGFQMTGLQVFI